MFGRLFKMDLKRCFSGGRVIVIIIGAVLLLLGSGMENITGNIGLSAEERQWLGALDLLHHVMGFDVFKVVVVLLLAGLYTHSFCQDEKHHYLRMVLCRCGSADYARSKFLANTLAIVSCSVIACILFAVVIMLMGFRFVSVGVWEGFLNSAYYRKMVSDYPVIYLLMMGLQFGMVTAACSSVGLLISSYQPDAYISIGSSGFIFFMMLSISSRAYTPFNLLRLVEMQSVLPSLDAANPWLMFLWGMLYPGIVIVLCCMKFEKRMKWRAEHGII